MKDNEFKNVFNEPNSNKNSISFGKNIFIPFLSGIVGCSVVIRSMFWCSTNKRKIGRKFKFEHQFTKC